MKQRLLIGTGLIALIAIITLVAFSAGAWSADEPGLATAGTQSESPENILDSPSQSEPVVSDTYDSPELTGPAAQATTEPDSAPAETASLVIEAEPRQQLTRSTVDQPGGPTQGIQVHGHWTIDVLEPDGKLVNHVEFDNALVTSGEEFLSQILAHDSSVGAWVIFLDGPSGNKICNTILGIQSTCTITEYVPSSLGPNVAGGLTSDAPSSGANSGSFVLAGSIEAANQGIVSSVSTGLRECATSVAPVDFMTCGSTVTTFTAAAIPDVPVLLGQTVDITVVISFS